MLEKQGYFYENSSQNSFSETFKAQRLGKILKRLDFVRNPRETISYFEEEMINEANIISVIPVI